MLNYPLSELTFKNDGEKPNIVLIVIDSWRYDTMNSDVSPNWHTILSERKEPVFMETLRKLDYNIGIWSSTQLTFPEFRKTAFIGVPDYIKDTLNGREAKERDPQHPELFDQWLGKRNDDDPFFAFLFLDAPHEPYSYPDEFTRYTPVVDEINYMNLDKDSNLAPFINHYKNAVYFDDHVTGQLIKILQNRKFQKSLNFL